jgi:hypothetical protein
MENDKLNAVIESLKKKGEDKSLSYNERIAAVQTAAQILDASSAIGNMPPAVDAKIISRKEYDATMKGKGIQEKVDLNRKLLRGGYRLAD